jgi:hypothetical protein
MDTNPSLMKTTIILAVAVMIVLLCIRVYHTPGQQPTVHIHQVAQHSIAIYHSENLYTEPPSEKYRYGSLQLYPIFASPFFLTYHQQLGPYLSLQEALDQKKIVITELTAKENQHIAPSAAQEHDHVVDEADVNRLFVENISSDTIIILGGEVVRGGKQDRMIAQDFMILPHSGKLDIAVYCVEQGRWTESEAPAVFAIAMDVAPNKVRGAAKAAAPQEKVWEEVADLNMDLEVSAPTEALASAVTDSKMEESIQPYKEQLGKINWPENVVGVIAVMGNEIVGLDVFAQHQLFIKYYPSLLSSYCSDAYALRDSTMVSYAEVQSFLNTLISSEAAFEKRIQEHGTQLEHNGYRIHGAVYGDGADKGSDR